jgi:hypothetical protein
MRASTATIDRWWAVELPLQGLAECGCCAIRLPNTAVPLSHPIELQSWIALGGNTVYDEQERDVKSRRVRAVSTKTPFLT